MLIEFCLPVHNEEDILEPNILRLYNYCNNKNYKFNWNIIIINNGSTDKTSEIAKTIAKKYDKIKAINILQPGKGGALKKYWNISRADILAYMDIDLAVSLDNVNDLINPILKNKADLVIGSRLLPESKIKRSLGRELSSRLYNFLSRLILNHNFSDMQCGFKAIKAVPLKEKNKYILDNEWFFDTELVYYFYHFNACVKEIPVDWQEERYDLRKSKLNIFKNGIKFIINLIKLKKRIKKLKPNPPNDR